MGFEVSPGENKKLALAELIDYRNDRGIDFTMTGEGDGEAQGDVVAPPVAENQTGLDAEVAQYGAGPYINTDYGWVNAGSVKGVTAIGLTQATTGNMSDGLASTVKSENETKNAVKAAFKQTM